MYDWEILEKKGVLGSGKHLGNGLLDGGDEEDYQEDTGFGGNGNLSICINSWCPPSIFLILVST